MKSLCIFLLLAWTTSASAAPSLEQVASPAPVIKPQPDGVVYLNVETAALLRSGFGHWMLTNHGGGILKPQNGSISDWSGDSEVPCWRIELPKAGHYRVVINRATGLGRESAAAINFWGAKRHSINMESPSTGSWDSFAPLAIGEVDLDAGDTVVEFLPTRWTSPLWLIRLADVRLIPVNDVQKSGAAVHSLLDKLGVTVDPEVATLEKQHAAAVRKLNDILQTMRNRDFSTYTDYRQFFQFDAAADDRNSAQNEETELARKLELLQETKLKQAAGGNQALSPADRDKLTAYFIAESTLLDGQTRVYPKTYFNAADAPSSDTSATSGRRKTLFPTGHFEDLPVQHIDTTLPTVQLKLAPPPDAAQRVKRFAARNDEVGIAALCRDLYAAVHPETPGLEDFARLYKNGQYQQALDAYRAYFFAKLADPEKYGAVTEDILLDLTQQRGRGELLFRPNPVALDDNLHNRAIAEIDHRVIVGEVGPPGAVWWAPSDLSMPPGATYDRGPVLDKEFWQSDAGRSLALKHEFFRYIKDLPADRAEYNQGGFFNALLFSYAVTGDRAHLQRWSDYLDDWTMNSKRDEDNCPWTPLMATELETQQVRCLFNLMRIILDERPQFATDFNSASLARVLLKVQADYAPYVIRAKRAEIANWGMMGLTGNLDDARFLQEFKASDYLGRESWRLWNINEIQHNTLDGENAEAWDTGHQLVATDFSMQGIPIAKFPPETSALEVPRFWDQMKVNMRDLLIHISPAGFYWPTWDAHIDFLHNDVQNRLLKRDMNGRYTLDLIDKEKGARQRIDTILNGGKPGEEGAPENFSDFSPYASMAYLRDSWQPTADYFILQNFRDRSQCMGDCARGMYDFSSGGRMLLEGHSLTVDGKPDYRYYGQLRTGGKTDFCSDLGFHVVPDRFYTSSRFDLAEATQDSPYAQPRFSKGPDPYNIYRATANGLDDPSPITDVIDHRHVFHPRGSGVWIIGDRVENKGAESHDYAQFFTLPVRLPLEGAADRVRLLKAAQYPIIEQSGNHLRTANPGFENVSAYFMSPVALTFANRQKSPGKYETLTAPILDAKQAAKPINQRPYAVAWSGKGNQNLVTVLYSRPATTDLSNPYGNDLTKFDEVHGADGVTGCHLITPSGAEVWFQSGPQPANALDCNGVTANAEALLVVKQDGKTSGLILGDKTATLDGRPVADSEFTLDAQGRPVTVGLIHRPIDTTQILPESDVFTDQAQVSFAIPTQDTSDLEFHYTLDGTDPTLASKLYDQPFTITDTTLVKVRPFRKGLKSTPWTDTGTDCGAMVSALFRKEAPLPATQVSDLQPGLNYSYFEDSWTKLFTYAGVDGVLKPKTTGHVQALLNPNDTAALRQTDRAYAIRYDGYVQMPAAGVYSFYAPAELYNTIADAGYDLRLFIDGKEWYPTPALHSENVWNVALEKGLHSFSAAYTDYRWKKFRDEYWMSWQPEEMWQGTPTLEVSGPGIARTPLPAAWLLRK